MNFTLFLLVVTLVISLGFSFNLVYAKEYSAHIPFGAYNPELNTPAEVWYEPSVIIIRVDDMITWFNDDREGHTVTSGQGSGRFGWMSDDFGTPDGYFVSGRFMPGESWSFTFTEAGKFQYYCTIHPWMESIVVVEELIPNYPHDATGKKIEFPLLQYTPDQNIEVNLTWEPHVIKTHEVIKFIYQFYNPLTNSNLQKMEYDIIIFQNGKEIFHDSGLNQIGGDYRNFVFEDSGSFIIRIEGIQSGIMLAEESTTVGGEVVNKAQRSVDFSGAVYDNPEKITPTEYQIKPAQRLEFYYELALALIIIPAGMFIGIIVWMKRSKPKYSATKSSAI